MLFCGIKIISRGRKGLSKLQGKGAECSLGSKGEGWQHSRLPLKFYLTVWPNPDNRGLEAYCSARVVRLDWNIELTRVGSIQPVCSFLVCECTYHLAVLAGAGNRKQAVAVQLGLGRLWLPFSQLSGLWETFFIIPMILIPQNKSMLVTMADNTEILFKAQSGRIWFGVCLVPFCLCCIVRERFA